MARRRDLENAPPWRDPVVEAYKKDLDRGSIRKNLKLTPEERVLQLIEMQELASELRRAGGALRRNR